MRDPVQTEMVILVIEKWEGLCKSKDNVEMGFTLSAMEKYWVLLFNFIEQFGGYRDVATFLGVVTLFFSVNSIITSKVIRIIVSVCSSAYVTAQLFSLYSIQSFIGYQFYIHLNVRSVAGMQGLFLIQMVLLVGVLTTLIPIYFSSPFIWNKWLRHSKSNIRIGVKVTAILIPLSFVLLIGDFIQDTRTLASLLTQPNSTADFREVLIKHDLIDYVTPEQIKVSPGKNIIIISVESLEQGFLSSKFASLTPNLRALKNKWNYYDVKQNNGSSWTSGSLYTYLTGFPAYFGGSGNSIFQSAFHSNISSITHALKIANYRTTYINGNTEHSGVNSMLSVLGIGKIIDTKNTPNSGYESDYGLRDKEVFQYAKNELDVLEESNQPFAIFISTTDTHFPDGIYDQRMKSVISPKSSNLEFSVATVDYLIADFIEFLEKKELLNNTVVFLFPDHLKMGDPEIFNGTGKRMLYVLTNADGQNFMADTTDLYQIDLPKVILNGAGISHNLKFLTDYISGGKDEFILDHIQAITEINAVGLSRVVEH